VLLDRSDHAPQVVNLLDGGRRFLTQEDIANMSGLNRTTVSASINDLRRRGVLGGGGRSLLVNRNAVYKILDEAGIEYEKPKKANE